ncbi:MAG: TRZ/ATZ family hydrolase [Neisseria sp.]|nr:TRZ/ATZ family hydrolase [Neisseria sp.]
MTDTLIFAPYMIPMDNEPTVLRDHALHIKGRGIAAIVPQAQARAIQAASVLHLDNHVLMPGLVNLHGHSAMTLLRGFADDLALMDWLNNHIWPAEGKHVDLPFVYDGTLLAMAEMIRGGTTTINDMYFFHGAVGKAALRMGMRTFIGASILEFPNRYAADAKGYINRALAEQTAFYGEDLVRFVLAPHAPYTVSDDTFREVVRIAERDDMLIHCHIHETADEVAGSLKDHGMRPLARLDKLGVLSERLIAAHMVHLTEEEIALTAKRGVSVAHNPSSNMKLASGCAPIQALLDAGANVGIGTDGAASNNKLDMFAETRLAALIAKGFSGSPTAFKAYDALKAATLGGARALHISDKIGSLHSGKRADMIAVDLSAIETQPLFDPISHLVYAADRNQVSHVWVNGEMLLDNRALTRIDLAEIHGKAAHWRDAIQAA